MCILRIWCTIRQPAAVTLFVDEDKARQTSRFLHHHGMAEHPIGAVERLIGAHYDMLTCDRSWQAAAWPGAVDLEKVALPGKGVAGSTSDTGEPQRLHTL